jgi:hypothetical protein
MIDVAKIIPSPGPIDSFAMFKFDDGNAGLLLGPPSPLSQINQFAFKFTDFLTDFDSGLSKHALPLDRAFGHANGNRPRGRQARQCLVMWYRHKTTREGE